MLCKPIQLALLAVSVEAAISADTTFKLYAYGTGIKSGLQLFYGDGNAYVGPTAPTFVSEGVNITLTTSTNDTQIVATPDSTTDWDSQPTLYIDTTEGSISPIGFVKDNEEIPDDATVAGFGLYGGWVFHKDDDSTIKMSFIATPTNETDIYQVKWNAGGTRTDEDIPISLRTQAPISPTL